MKLKSRLRYELVTAKNKLKQCQHELEQCKAIIIKLKEGAK